MELAERRVIVTAMVIVRRAIAILLFLTIGLGMSVLSAQFGEMAQSGVPPAVDLTMPADCGSCNEDDVIPSSATCTPSCIGTSVEIWGSGPNFGNPVKFLLLAGSESGSWAMPPEPQPPRVYILV